MPRPRKLRKICFCPQVTLFKPRGIPLRNLELQELSMEEMEAIRLRFVEGLDQMACAKVMHTSQSTFARILNQAQQKIADAIIHGKAIKINSDI